MRTGVSSFLGGFLGALPSFYILFNCVALVGKRPAEQPRVGPRAVAGLRTVHKRSEAWSDPGAGSTQENMLHLRDRPEERQFIKMCFPAGKSDSDLCPQSSPDHSGGDIIQLGAGAAIFRKGHWFGLSPKASGPP